MVKESSFSLRSLLEKQITKAKRAPKYKGKGKLVPIANTPMINVSADTDCYYCNGKGHWKRNCPKYLEDLKIENVSKASVSSTFVVEVNVAISINDWVIVTRSCAHICSNM
jgi:DnaJ-class molecular chaperone